MWTYSQTTGLIRHDGESVGDGYSGHGSGLNNGALEAVEGVGPIPRGMWRITQWDQMHAQLGPVVAILTPVDQDAHGRSCFRIHGDNAALNHTASDGCIIAPRVVREEWRASGDLDLEVTI